MTTPKQTNAHLLRRAEKAERLLEAEKVLGNQAWDGYRKALAELVELKMRLEAVDRALKGEA